MNLWFVTPVYRRFHLAKVCLEQRARMIERLPFEAHCVVVGNDENCDYARELGFDVVTLDNSYVGRKWNHGYEHAYEQGATHIMPIGSDSFLHESSFEGWELVEHKGHAMVGLSSFAPDGSERVDLRVRYPAGFGVGMIYPAEALYAKRLRNQACDPQKQRGCDNSTWERVGRGRVKLEFLEYMPYVYCNFHSYDESITDFRSVQRANGRVVGRDKGDPLGVLRGLYDDDLVEEIERLWALRSLQVFLTGKQPFFFNPHARVRRGYPQVGERGYVSAKKGMVTRRYPKVASRRKTAAERAEKLAENKARGLPLSRDEEMILRFDAARG